jgi:hypothetical protein
MWIGPRYLCRLYDKSLCRYGNLCPGILIVAPGMSRNLSAIGYTKHVADELAMGMVPKANPSQYSHISNRLPKKI